MDVKAKAILATVSIILILFFGFKAMTKNAQATEPKAKEPLSMIHYQILGCKEWIEHEGKNYCLTGG